ncbi:aldose 1-epimerase family protein [Marinifilum caeruleilacunae]|uniref:Aldose 1-epimerase family protein n=1 Tax=Marinifilum caeruleilacunae TaxID=2499076 RepID=A0ABX1WSV2_9BACT|nr:aldose 1-epimerase family protein [Marinifilum caeruleilacunae]NOU59188.1 aldose 1-epimerase family protein [Marinifilum caeruleilacunae]
MKYTIQNDHLKVTVLEKGAELCSIESMLNGSEYIWQANPDIWGSHAPNLFPIIGCLKDNAFIHEGKEYAMPKHGFIRNNTDVKLFEQKEDRLIFILQSNENTRKVYPFEFEFKIHFILAGNKLKLVHEISNTGEGEMLFNLGGHPAFNCQLHEGEDYTDYYLEFDQKETLNTWNLSDGGLIASEGKQILNDSKIIKLHPEIFANDALILKNLKSSSVSLKCKKSDFELKVKFDGFPYLGLWAKAHAPYVCIEPWIGIADRADTNREFSSKELLQRLSPQDTFTAEYSIEINH